MEASERDSGGSLPTVLREGWVFKATAYDDFVVPRCTTVYSDGKFVTFHDVDSQSTTNKKVSA